MAALTSLANLKVYLPLPLNTTVSDALLRRLIASESRSIEQYLSRKFPYTEFVKAVDGTGSRVLCFPTSPALSVTSVVSNGAAIPQSTDGVFAAGYAWDEDALYLIGDVWPCGRKNVTVSWSAGWAGSVTDTPDASNTITPIDDGYAATDRGVIYAATGSPLARVATLTAAGQYLFAEGVYTFHAADQIASLTCSYYYVPAAVEEACIEMVAESMHRRPNIGTRTKSIEGQTTTFTDGGMTPHVMQLLFPFQQLAPL